MEVTEDTSLIIKTLSGQCQPSIEMVQITYAEWHKNPKSGFLSNPYIVVYDFTNEVKTFITNDSFECWRPIFSPNDKGLFYISKENNNQFDVYEHSFKTNQKKNITQSDFEEWDVALSYDEKYLISVTKMGIGICFVELETAKFYS